MRPAAVRLTGNPSRYDRSPVSLLRAVRRYALVSNFIADTEVADNDRSAVLTRVPGFAVTHFEDARRGEDESAIQFRRLWWKQIRAKADPLSVNGIPARGMTKAHSVDALYRNRRTGQTVQFCAFHLPQRDEGQLAIWLDCIETLMEKWDRWTRDPDIDCVILVGDWNANWRSESIRRELRAAFPGAEWTWGDGRAPTTNGTHGFRLIDYAAVWGGTITRAELLADDASSDHRPWWMRVVVS